MEKPLNEKDLALTDKIIGLFKSVYTGSEKAVKTDKMIFDIGNLGTYTTGTSIRNVIGHIRREDMLAPGYIISDVNTGYWLSYDEREMSDFVDQQMNRMTNQFQNLKRLHHRVKNNKRSSGNVQPALF